MKKSILYSYMALAMLLMPFNLQAQPFNVDQIQSNLDGAYFLTQGVKNQAIQEELYFYLIDEYSKKGNLDRLNLIISQIPTEQSHLKRPLYSRYFVTHYNTFSAKETLSQLKYYDDLLRNFLLEQCFDKAIRSSNIVDARLFLSNVKNPIIYSRLASQLIHLYLSTQQLSKAEKLLTTIKLPVEKEKAMIDVIIYKLNQDNSKSINIDDIYDNLTLEDVKTSFIYKLVPVLTRQGNLDEALDYLLYLNSKEAYEKGLSYIIITLCELNKMDQALYYAQSLTDSNLRQQLLVNFGMSFAKQSNVEWVKNILTKITNEAVKEKFLIEISLELAKQNLLEEALDLYQQLSITQQVNYCKDLAHEFANKDNFHFNLLILKKLDDMEFFDTMMAHFSQRLAILNNHEQAIEVLTDISNETLKNETYISILLELPDEKTMDIYKPTLTDSIIYEFALAINGRSMLSSDAKLSWFELVLDNDQLSIEDQIEIQLQMALSFINSGNLKKAKKQLKQTRSLLKKINYKVDYEILKYAVSVESKIGSTNEIFKLFNHYDPRTDVLFLFHELNIQQDQSDLKLFKKNVAKLANTLN